jgi:hypothetical protein
MGDPDLSPRVDAVLAAQSVRATAVAVPSVTVRVSNAMWLRWAEIAVENEHASYIPRLGRKRSDPGDAIAPEQKAAMISITAAAHALDAFCGRFTEVMPERLRSNWKSGSGKRALQVWDTLRHGFTKRKLSWKSALLWLFTELRNPALHYLEVPQETKKHPYYDTHVNPDIAHYSAETATNAVDLMMDIMLTSLSSPREEVAHKAQGMLRLAETLAVQRRSNASARLSRDTTTQT